MCKVVHAADAHSAGSFRLTAHSQLALGRLFDNGCAGDYGDLAPFMQRLLCIDEIRRLHMCGCESCRPPAARLLHVPRE